MNPANNNHIQPLTTNSKPCTNLMGKNLAIESGIALAVSTVALAILNPYTIASISHVVPSLGAFLAKFEICTIIVSNPVILGVVAGALSLLAIALIVGIIIAVKESNKGHDLSIKSMPVEENSVDKQKRLEEKVKKQYYELEYIKNSWYLPHPKNLPEIVSTIPNIEGHTRWVMTEKFREYYKDLIEIKKLRTDEVSTYVERLTEVLNRGISFIN
jgi:hypothetical protein